MSSGTPYQSPLPPGSPVPPPSQGQYQQNPYQQPPQVQYPAPPRKGEIPYVQQPKRKYPHVTQCPRCGNPFIKEVRNTWWGGVLGPSMMSLMRCPACKLNLNAKKMQDASNGILIYTVVSTTIAVVGGLLYFFLSRR